LEDVLARVGLASDEIDLVVGALELPEVTVARDVHEALHGSSVSLVVEDQRGRGFVPIPGIVGMILEVAFDRAAGGVEGDNRAGIEIVAGALIAEPRAAVAGAPEGEVGPGVVGARDPDRGAAAFIVIAARRPGLASGLTRRGDRVRLPQFLPGLRIERREEAAHAQFAAGR